MDWWPRDIVDLVQQPILGLREQKVVRANEAAHGLLGYTQFELLNRPYNRLFRKAGTRLFCARRDGSEFHARLRSAVVADDAVVVLVGNESEKQACTSCTQWIDDYTDVLDQAVQKLQALAQEQDASIRDSLREIADHIADAHRAATSVQKNRPRSR